MLKLNQDLVRPFSFLAMSALTFYQIRLTYNFWNPGTQGSPSLDYAQILVYFTFLSCTFLFLSFLFLFMCLERRWAISRYSSRDLILPLRIWTPLGLLSALALYKMGRPIEELVMIVMIFSTLGLIKGLDEL